jgi:hypothetical protein
VGKQRVFDLNGMVGEKKGRRKAFSKCIANSTKFHSESPE